MRRVVIVYNPRSSKAERVREEVILMAQKRPGLMIGKYGVLKTNVDDNAQRLAKILQDGDTVVAAGGDATAAIALNGAMLSEKEVYLGVLPYGNFNDMATAFKGQEGKTWYPLEVLVDGKRWRYAGSYFSVGMMAESTEIFNEKAERKKLQKKQGGIVHSVRMLEHWYFKHKKNEFLPEMKLNGEKLKKRTSDYLAINGKTVAKVMKGDQYGLMRRTFFSSTGRLTNFFRLMRFMRKSCLTHIPGEGTRGDKLEFLEPATVKVQAEGESEKFVRASKIEVRKAKRGIKIVEKVW